MLRYPGQFKDDYCLAKVITAKPDDDNLVRKVTVTFKKKNPRESLAVCKSKPMITEEVAIHRLHRLQLIDDEFHGHLPEALEQGPAGVFHQVGNDLGGSVGSGLGGDVPMAVSGHAGCEAEAICEGRAHDLLQAGHDAEAALSEN